MQNLKTHLFKTKHPSCALLVIAGTMIVVAAGLIFTDYGRYFLTSLFVPEGPASIEPETASLSGPVIVGYDINASGGQYIEFGASSFQPSAPYHATFFYPWSENPNTDGKWSYWNDGGHSPSQNWFSNYIPDSDPANFDPANELYSSNNDQIIYWQLRKLAEARQEVAISEWWGQGHKTDNSFRKIVTDIMNRPDNPYSDFRWTIYYAKEGFGDPTVGEIVDDLNYVKTSYTDQPAYLKIDDKPVIFVYGDINDGSGMASRWAQAKSQVDFYIVLKVYAGYRSDPNQPNSWHQYAPAVRADNQAPYSYSVSPGFWKDGEALRLGRDLTSFRNAVSDMVAANATWKLTETWNEWGEGSSIEPGEQVIQVTSGSAMLDPNGVTFNNAYVDVLKDLLPPLEGGTVLTSLIGETLAAQTDGTSSFFFTASGDYGGPKTETDRTLQEIANSGAVFTLALGDMSYEDAGSEPTDGVTPSPWCPYIKSYLGEAYPFEIVVGNHEEDSRVDGFIRNFAVCLPDRMNSTGDYSTEYYFDYPAASPLIRVIMIGAGHKVDGVDYQYCNSADSGNTRCNWLGNKIDSARAAGIPWVAVGMHKNCITMGNKSCEIGEELIDFLINKKVDLILQGHDHDYQRGKQLTCADVNSYRPECVVDDGADGVYAKGSGSVIIIQGNPGGGGFTSINCGDNERNYFARAQGGDGNAWDGSQCNSEGVGRGVMIYTVSPTRIDAEFILTTQTRSGTPFSDSFSIIGGPPDTEKPTKPMNLSATAVSSSQVDLAWTASTDNVGVAGYKIFRNDTQIDTTSTNFYSDVSVSPSTIYSYYVVAYDAARNDSDPSNIDVVTTPCGLPNDKGAVTHTVSLAAGTYKIWSRIMAPDNASNSYYLQVDGDCGTVVGGSAIAADSWTWIDYKDADASSKITMDLSSGDHIIRMVGRETGVKLDRVILTADLSCTPIGNGGNCVGAPGDDTQNPVVQIISPADGLTLSGAVSIQVIATDNIGVTRVEFYIDNNLEGTDNSFPYSYIWNSTTVADGSHIITAKAYDAANNEGLSDAINIVIINDDTESPTAPTNLTATAVSGSRVDLSWTASMDNMGVTGYSIARNGIALSTTAHTDYSDMTVAPSTTYNYQVTAYDAAANFSDPSNTVTVTTPDVAESQEVNIRVSQSSDDAEERISNGSVRFTSPDLELTSDGSNNQVVGIRFQNVLIPKGATIISAYIEFETDATDSGLTNLTFYGEDGDNALTFSTSSHNISNRIKTTTSVNWDNIPAWNMIDEKHKTPDMSSIIQEIVTRPGWLSGNAIAIIVIGSGERTAKSYNGEPLAAPLLHVEYRETDVDTDSDGFTNHEEYFMGTDPLSACGINAWPPDFNDDGVVQIDDLMAVSNRFGSKVGDANYSPRYELTSQNGTIQIDDVAKISGLFGRSCLP